MKHVSLLILLAVFSLSSIDAAVSFSKGVSQRNILNLQRINTFSLPKVKKTLSSSNPDTIYVVAFRVEFQEDSTTLTTGSGLFDSDTQYYSSKAYKYDKKPHDKEYFEKHLEFLKNYYNEISDGKLVIQYDVYPKISRGAYRVKKEMRDYNPSEKKPEESYCDFAVRQSQSMMQFIKDAITAADDSAALGNPFDNNYNPNKTAYLLIHAGASAFADGGYYQFLGKGAKNSYSDFFDFFVSKRDIQYSFKSDYISAASGKTKIEDLMMVSETGNQDSVNFGINGVLVNQLARQLGVPDLYGVSGECAGISAIGSFCIMDFSGYINQSLGFIPVYPSAWVRAFLGWTNPVVCKSGVDSTYKVFAANLDTANEILQVPLNENEYLLIENRQRNLHNKKWFNIDTIQNTSETFTGNLILDSLVETSGTSNVVVNAKDYDAGLPGSGLLIWHIDESMLRTYYNFNAVNIDSSRRAVFPIEADGIQDIGAQFSNFLGAPVQDYGQPNDFFSNYNVSTKKNVNSLTNVYAHDGGLIKISIENIRPNTSAPETLFAEGHGKEEGARIVNYGSDFFTLDVIWNHNQGNWPQLGDSAASKNHPAAVDMIDSLPGKEIFAFSESGSIFAWSNNGIYLGTVTDSIAVTNVKNDTLNWAFRKTLFDVKDSLNTPAVIGDTVFSAGKRNLYFIYKSSSNSISIDSIPISFAASAGPGISDGNIYLADTAGIIHVYSNMLEIYTLYPGFTFPVSSFGICDIDNNGESDIIAAYKNGFVVCFEDKEIKWTQNNFTDLSEPKIAIGNIENSSDNTKEIAVVGKSGNVYLLDKDGNYSSKYWPLKIKRDNYSMPALADLDGDGFLDIVICGTNRIYALDRKGNFLKNWPVLLDSRNDLGEISCSPTIADADGDGNPDVILGFGFIDFIKTAKDTSKNIDTIVDGSYAVGQVIAITGSGSLPGTGGANENFNTIWPFTTSTPVVSSLLIDDIDNDSALEITGASMGGWAYAWKLDATRNKSAKVFWNGGSGNISRNPVYKDSLLPATTTAQDSKLKIQTFYCYPNPLVRNNNITLRYFLTRDAQKVSAVLYDSENEHLETYNGLTGDFSWNRYVIDFSKRPSGVYRVKLVAEGNSMRDVVFRKIAVIK